MILRWLRYQWHLMDGSAGGSCYYGCPICKDWKR